MRVYMDYMIGTTPRITTGWQWPARALHIGCARWWARVCFIAFVAARASPLGLDIIGLFQRTQFDMANRTQGRQCGCHC